MNKEFKKKLISAFQSNEKDTGSIELQVALLTHRIETLTTHFQSHKKDYGSKRGLFKMVSRRKKYLEYLKNHDTAKYEDLIGRLGIRK